MNLAPMRARNNLIQGLCRTIFSHNRPYLPIESCPPDHLPHFHKLILNQQSVHVPTHTHTHTHHLGDVEPVSPAPAADDLVADFLAAPPPRDLQSFNFVSCGTTGEAFLRLCALLQQTPSGTYCLADAPFPLAPQAPKRPFRSQSIHGRHSPHSRRSSPCGLSLRDSETCLLFHLSLKVLMDSGQRL